MDGFRRLCQHGRAKRKKTAMSAAFFEKIIHDLKFEM